MGVTNPNKKRTIVYNSLQKFKTMVQWKFDILLKNYGTMEKTMVLQKKLWYYGKNYGTIVSYGKL